MQIVYNIMKIKNVLNVQLINIQIQQVNFVVKQELILLTIHVYHKHI